MERPGFILAEWFGLFLSLPGEHGSQKQHTHPPEKLPTGSSAQRWGRPLLGRPCLVPTPHPPPLPLRVCQGSVQGTAADIKAHSGGLFSSSLIHSNY